MKEYDSHHGLKFSYTYEYSNFDKQGNWLSRASFKNDQPASVTERKIEYN
jgi:hypothetical protein